MEVIRRNVFETNSSSTHSISISGDDSVQDKLNLDENGVLTVYPGEFGWDEETFTDAATKASYLATYVKNYHPEKEQILVDGLKKKTGAKEVIFHEWGESHWHSTGYIDHQSIDVAHEALESVQSVIDFVFNRNSVLRTDNDNH